MKGKRWMTNERKLDVDHKLIERDDREKVGRDREKKMGKGEKIGMSAWFHPEEKEKWSTGREAEGY